MPKSQKYHKTESILNKNLLYRLKSGKLMKDTISDLKSEIYMEK